MMPRLLWLVAAFAGKLAALQPSSTLKATNVVYNNNDNYYFDISGNAITSTNGKVQWIKDQYLWVAEPMCRSWHISTAKYVSDLIQHVDRSYAIRSPTPPMIFKRGCPMVHVSTSIDRADGGV